MLELPNVTLVTVTGTNYINHQKALIYSANYIRFGLVLYIADKAEIPFPNSKHNLFQYNIINQITSKSDYSKFIVYQLYKYINTEYCILIQPDGFILNPNQWREEFLDYDYIGAPWPPFYHDLNGNCHRVGNGGFSLRSKKLLEVSSKESFELHYDSLTKDAEDVNICCYRREIYEKHGCKFAPIEVASKFSIENTTMVPELDLTYPPFGFHTCYGYQDEPNIHNKLYFPVFK